MFFKELFVREHIQHRLDAHTCTDNGNDEQRRLMFLITLGTACFIHLRGQARSRSLRFNVACVLMMLPQRMMLLHPAPAPKQVCC